MNGVELKKMVQELNLYNKTPEVDISKKMINTPEINRPALQLTGYLEHFENERVQIIGYVEYTYLFTSVEKKKSWLSRDLSPAKFHVWYSPR